jgi:hypothetical protein
LNGKKKNMGSSSPKKFGNSRNPPPLPLRVPEIASNSTEAFINGERPWVVPTIRKKVRWIDTISASEENLGKFIKKRMVYFTFSGRNHGRTPAEVFAIRGNPRLTNKGRNGGLEDPPDYGAEHVFMQVKMLAPGERWDYTDVLLNPWDFGDEALKSIESQKLHIIFKGVVLYYDTFRREVVHESRFCYT